MGEGEVKAIGRGGRTNTAGDCEREGVEEDGV
jgi:hypothetical protein